MAGEQTSGDYDVTLFAAEAERSFDGWINAARDREIEINPHEMLMSSGGRLWSL